MDWFSRRPRERATITVSEIPLDVDSSAAQAIPDEQQGGDGETVTYRSKSARQAVISGTRGDMIFYRKLIISCKDQILNHLEIEYPAAHKQAFDGLVAHVAGSLHSGPSWQTSSCKIERDNCLSLICGQRIRSSWKTGTHPRVRPGICYNEIPSHRIKPNASSSRHRGFIRLARCDNLQ